MLTFLWTWRGHPKETVAGPRLHFIFVYKIRKNSERRKETAAMIKNTNKQLTMETNKILH